VIDVGATSLTLMVAGSPDNIDAMTDLLAPHGIVELQRTGRIALPRLVRGGRPLKAVKGASA
jgi:acetolactate synthase-1/3 small subunit